MGFQPLLFSGFIIGSSSGSSATIGGPVVGGVAGSVLFINPIGTLSQDNANFNFNPTTHALTISGVLSASNVSGSNTGDVTIGTSNGLSLSSQVLSLQLATTSLTGALSSTDWNTFNNKQPAFTSQSQNLFYASPNGSSGIPGFRSIVSADLPSLSTIYIPQIEAGVANGVATLDPSGKIPVSQLPSVVFQYEGSWNPATNTPALSDGTGTNGFVYYVNTAFIGPDVGLTDPSMVNFSVGNLIIYSASVGKWQQTSPAAGVLSVNSAQGVVTVNAINQLTGDVTAGPASGSQSKAATIASIQGTAVTGTTGSGNVVLSASPTLTGALNASSGIFASTISASNLSGTNTGDQTITLTGGVTGSGTGSFATTLATVNGNVGSFGSSTSIPSFTVNAKGLITAASGNVVIAPAGTLSGTTLASTVVTSSLTSIGAQSQALNMNSNLINNVTNPVSAQDAATKSYVDAVTSALNPATSVYAATTANISGTYLNGVGGIGATFTTTATGTFTVDGVTPPLGSRILIKDQSSGFQNGIYNLTTLGSIGISAVFTRAFDYDTPTEINNAGLIPVINGTVNALTSWQQIAIITTVGTDALVFTEFTANPSLYLLKANNLSDVTSAATSFANITQPASGILQGSISLANQTMGTGIKTFSSNPVFSAMSTAGVLLNDASGNITSSAGPLTVNAGGTGLTTLTTGNVILGAGTSTPTFVAPSTSGNVLTSNGSTWISSVPSPATTTTYAWSGYHSCAAGNAFNWQSATFVDPTNIDSSVTIHEINNSNFGTVSGYGANSGSGAKMGFVFTPVVIGFYYVKASFSVNLNPSLNNFRLWDGTTSIDSSIEFSPPVAETASPIIMSGILQVTSLSPVTISIQAASATQGFTHTTAVTGVHFIDWSIFKIN